MTRPFGDPVFPAWASRTAPPSLYARKWSNDQSTSEEVIGITALQPDAEEAFVCTANPVWAAPPETKPHPIPTGTLIYHAVLLDFDVATQKQYAKDVPAGSALNWVMRNLPAAIKYEWPLTQRQ